MSMTRGNENQLGEIDPSLDLHYRDAIAATLIGLGVNFTLGVVKLVGGIVGQSFALISDSINSLGDSVASIVTIIALRFAQLPADDEHPYGHTRAEAIAGLCVAIVIIQSGVYVGWEAITHLQAAYTPPPVWTLLIAGSNVVIKETLYWYNYGVGSRTGSTAIIANAWDHRSDALCSLAVFLGLTLIIIGGSDWMWADGTVALLVAIVIIWSGIRLLINSVSELLDPQASEELVLEIRNQAERVAGVREVEKLWVRKTGIEYLIDIHIQVDAAMTVADGHRIGHQVKDQLTAKFACVRNVLVHLEPFPHEHKHVTSQSS